MYERCQEAVKIYGSPIKHTVFVNGKLQCKSNPYHSDKIEEIFLYGVFRSNDRTIYQNVKTFDDGTFLLTYSIEKECENDFPEIWFSIRNICTKDKEVIESPQFYMNNMVSFGYDLEVVTLNINFIEPSHESTYDFKHSMVAKQKQYAKKCRNAEEIAKKKRCQFRQSLFAQGRLLCNGETYHNENGNEVFLYGHIYGKNEIYKSVRTDVNGNFDIAHIVEKQCENEFPHWFLVVNNTCNEDKKSFPKPKYLLNNRISFGCEIIKVVDLGDVELNNNQLFLYNRDL